MNISMLRALCGALTLLPGSLLAVEPHGSVGLQQHQVSIDGTTFNSRALTGVIGFWLQPGIGIGAGLSLPFSSETENEVTVDMDSLLTVSLRFESPPTLNGTSVFFLGGLASARIEAVDSGGQRAGIRSYSGPFFGFGLAHQISKNLTFTADYVQHTVDESIDIPSAQIALRRYF